jgi:hypothetical protein
LNHTALGDAITAQTCAERCDPASIFVIKQ